MVHAQKSGIISFPAKIGVMADPVATGSVFGVLPSSSVICSQVASFETIASMREAIVDETQDVAFQSCDVEGFAVQHSVPTADDPRYFRAAIIDVTSGASTSMDVQYKGAGAYLVKLRPTALGSYRLELRLGGELVDQALTFEAVCKIGLYKAMDGTCQACSSLDDLRTPLLESPICKEKGMTIQNLILAPNTWRATANTSNIFLCKRSKGCVGGPGNLSYSYESTRGLGMSVDGYCAYGHTGALCSACQPQFFMTSAKHCTDCKDMAMKIAFIVTAVVIVFVLIYAGYVNRAKIQVCLYATMCVRRSITMARLKIVLSTYQIIAAVMWGVPDVRWPEPFSTFGTLLEMLNFFVIGTACISDGYNFYVQIFMVTLTPIFLSGLIFAAMHVRMKWMVPKDHKNPDQFKTSVRRQHWWTFILLTYCVMPSTSVSIFRVFLCHPGFGDDMNEAYLRADYALHCYTEDLETGAIVYTFSHTLMRIYAGIMILVYPIGINTMYFTLLRRNRAIINPKQQTIEKAVMLRASTRRSRTSLSSTDTTSRGATCTRTSTRSAASSSAASSSSSRRRTTRTIAASPS